MYEQEETLADRAFERHWSVEWWCNKGDLNSFLNHVIHGMRVRVQGVMFWHAGHVAGSLDGFIEVIQVLNEHNLVWYVEHPRIHSDGDTGRMLVSLSSDLRGIYREITQLNLRERSADMKARGTNPGRKKLTAEIKKKIRSYSRDGYKMKEIADFLNVSYVSVTRVLKETEP